MGDSKDYQHTTLSLVPPIEVRSDGSFELEIPEKPGQMGEETFPTLVIEHPDYEPSYVHLSDDALLPLPDKVHVHLDKSARTIAIKDKIVLRKKDIARFSANQVPKPVSGDP
jgi:hypothetical protein